jgi:hypothetical protein
MRHVGTPSGVQPHNTSLWYEKLHVCVHQQQSFLHAPQVQHTQLHLLMTTVTMQPALNTRTTLQ